jgi:hypothetical protein
MTTMSADDISHTRICEYQRYTGFVRVRMPETYSSSFIDERPCWTMTTQDITIGTINSLSEIDGDEDNGFFVFSFDFVNEAEAEITEQILRHEFRRCTFHAEPLRYPLGLCYGDRFCTQLLAQSLSYEEYSPSSYDAYMEVARRLFARMVAIAKLNWPHHYSEHNNGYRYEIKEHISQEDTNQRKLFITCAPIMTKG